MHRFTLSVAYPQKSVSTAEVSTPGQPAPSVLLSPIPQSPPGMASSGPQLGAPPAPTEMPDITALGFSISDEPATQYLLAINTLRRARGLGAVTPSPALSRAAVAHVRALAGA